MRIDTIIAAIEARQCAVEETVFKNPPQSHEDFKKQLGFWQGLGEALRIINEAIKDKDDD